MTWCEYVITDPRTPVKWINYIGTLAFGGFVDHTGGAALCANDPALNRITRYVTQMPAGDFRGTGPGIVAPFERRAREAETSGNLTFLFRHRVDALSISNGSVDGVTGVVLEPDDVARGKSSSRKVIAEFSLHAQAVIVASGGIGGNHDLVRQNWPTRLGDAPKHMISGVPEHVDGRMIGITEAAGARLINRDRMWHYVEGIL